MVPVVRKYGKRMKVTEGFGAKARESEYVDSDDHKWSAQEELFRANFHGVRVARFNDLLRLTSMRESRGI